MKENPITEVKEEAEDENESSIRKSKMNSTRHQNSNFKLLQTSNIDEDANSNFLTLDDARERSNSATKNSP